MAIVINADSAVSREIGEYYRAARGIPESNICIIRCPDQELVSRSVCETSIREPVRQFLTRPEVAGKIDYIVMTKGTPLAADYGDLTGPHSVSSILTCVDHPATKGALCFPYGPCASLCWPRSAPEAAWSHSTDFFGYHFYLVTRLDAFTVDQVKTMIDRSLTPARSGRFVLDRNSYVDGSYRAANDRLGDRPGSAYALLTARGLTVDFDPDKAFLSGLQDVMGYFGWGCLDDEYTYEGYVSNRFVAGSIGDTYYSGSGRTFRDPGTTARQSLIADLIGCGLNGCAGYVSEPCVGDATYANVLFDRYTKGYNMAESFYAGCPEVFWKTVVVGDPLMAAYADPPAVSLVEVGAVASGVTTITAQASAPAGISKVKFYFDNDLLGTVATTPYSVSVDTTRYGNGPHTIEAIAYENAATATQGFVRQRVTVENAGLVVARIGEAFRLPDGQRVWLSAKTVVAGAGEAGSGFYIEENDRSSGIEVLGGTAVARGEVVTLTGDVCTLDGVKAIQNATVQVLGVKAAQPAPFIVNLRHLGGQGIGCVSPIGYPGARNVGMLLMTYGLVKTSASGSFWLSDGSKRLPVKVLCPTGSEPAVGSRVFVTGICASEYAASRYVPVMRVRDAADIRVYSPQIP